MSVKAFKCIVELTIHEVNAPGTRLANKDDLYLNVCLLGQQRRTRLVSGQFPARFSDHLIFEKTFKYCRDPADVVDFLGDLHVLIELIQLGRSENNEVLAWYETNARDFLYPIPAEIKPNYHSAQRDVFLYRNNEFPGTISPQLQFCTSTRIDETQTPSMDILKEYENRFVNDPLIEISRQNGAGSGRRIPSASLSGKRRIGRRKNKRRAANNPQQQQQGILRNYPDNFSNHTISSAIKADYNKPDVRFKLDELNSSVKKTKVIKKIPKISIVDQQRPFVVRHVDDYLILRKPELHDVLNDGLVVFRKNGKRYHYRYNNGRPSISRSRSPSVELRSQSLNSLPRTTSRSYSYGDVNQPEQFNRSNDSALFYQVNNNNNNNGQQHRSRSLDRLSRSLSPNRQQLGPSLNENLSIENDRHPRHYHHRSRSGSRSSLSTSRQPTRNHDRTFDISSGLEINNNLNASSSSLNKYDTNLENCNVCSNSHSNCEVCQDYRYRTNQNFRGHRFHRNENELKSMNSSAIFSRTTPFSKREKDPLNETQLLNSDDLAHVTFADNYSTSSFREAHELSNQISNSIKKNINNYPKNKSLSYYGPPANKLNWRYNRYYPWLFNYTEYIRELEDELNMLKLKSQYLSQK